MSSQHKIDSVLRLELPPSRKRQKTTDFSLCIFCQEKKKSPLVVPKTYEKALECIKRRAELEEIEYVNLLSQLSNFSLASLQDEDAKWHSECYKKCTHKANIERSERLYQTRLLEPTPSDSECVETSRNYILRSKTLAYDKENCIFCNKESTKRDQLRKITTDLAVFRLKSAIEISQREDLKVRLSDCSDPYQSRDIAYHKTCWNTHVVNILRPKPCKSDPLVSNCYQGTNAEFIASLNDFLLEGNVTTMGEIETYYNTLASKNGLPERQRMSRKQLKCFIEDELEALGIVFSNPKRLNEPQRISLKTTADVALSSNEEGYKGAEHDMRILHEASVILRKSVEKCEKWAFTGSFNDVNIEEVVPEEVCIFFKWCVQGQINIRSAPQNRDINTTKTALKLSQMFMFEILSPKQASNASAIISRHTRQLPLQVAVGLTMHTSTRSKFIIEMLHRIGVSIDYAKVLRLETQIATEVINRTKESGGVYIPSDLVKGRFVYCAADNVDFQEDTPYGTGTLHGTVMVIYQAKEESDSQNPIEISGKSSIRSLQSVPQLLSETVKGSIPKGCRPKNPVLNQKTASIERNIHNLCSYRNEDLIWMIAQSSLLTTYVDSISNDDQETNFNQGQEIQNEDGSEVSNSVPIWSAYNSIMNDKPMNETRICVLPLIDSSPTKVDTQLTMMSKLEQVTSNITPGKKTVVTLDLGLYRPVLKLSMVKKDLSTNWILRPGELHIIMAMLRCIGKFIDGTGLETTLTVLYDETVVSQILSGKCVRRAINAHISLRLALFKCVFDEFVKNNSEIEGSVKSHFDKLLTDLQGENIQEMKTSHFEVIKVLEDVNVLSKLDSFQASEANEKPTFKVVHQYITMVDTMLLFIRSVRTGNWALHLSSLEEFVKYFFALDFLNYASMISWYLAEMIQLEKKDPDLWSELSSGRWVVSKTNMNFCCLGTDEALEQENRAMKVLGGVVNITQRKPALARFFLASPELSRISKESKEMLGMTDGRDDVKRSKHHDLTACKASRQQKDSQRIYDYLMTLTNPLTYEGKELINISTKVVFAESTQNDTTRLSEKGLQMYNVFKQERIESDKCSLWEPVKKAKLQLCSKARKIVLTKLSDSVMQLKADRSLFTRLLIVSRSRPDIDLQQCLSDYEFSVVPRSMFNLDGSMILNSNKSSLMKILERLGTPISDNTTQKALSLNDEQAAQSNQTNRLKHSVAVIDGMAEVQCMQKDSSVKTCQDLSVEFIKKIDRYLTKYDETHLVFDTYVERSLKNSMRKKRAGQTTPVQYKITDSTDIRKVTFRALLSHQRTKDELTAYLANKVVLHAQKTKKSLVVSWRDDAKSSVGTDVTQLASTHEEADTKIILHCLNVSDRASTLHIYSPDTDVFVLLLWWSQLLPPDSVFMTGAGANRRSIELNRVYSCLNPKQVKALLGLHALSGCDTTGCFKNRGKQSFWKVFESSEEDVLEAFNRFGCPEIFTSEDEKLIESFICRMYLQSKQFSDIGELRWWMFTKKDVQSENLPPTRPVLHQHILRTHYQVMEWRRANLPHPDLPDPSNFGWERRGNEYFPIMSNTLCAPEAILQLVRCGCKKGRCAVNCKCRAQSLRCTELCKCGAQEELCENNDVQMSDSDDDL